MRLLIRPPNIKPLKCHNFGRTCSDCGVKNTVPINGTILVLLINHSTKEQSELSTETCSAPLAQLCAFDVLAMDGDDLRNLPLSMRKANLARLLARRPEGIFISEFEQGEIGP